MMSTTRTTNIFEPRTFRKRRAILDAATTLFLRGGFRGTSMDEVAAAAAVSKQTVYKQFGSKEGLFRAIIEGVAANSARVVQVIEEAFGQSPAKTRDEFEARLAGVARAYLDAVLEPRMLSVRRLIISEAEQFPDLARMYYAHAPARGIAVIEECLCPYAGAGLIDARDLEAAATHFAYLALAVAQDRALFHPSEAGAPGERERLSAEAARVFLVAYGS